MDRIADGARLAALRELGVVDTPPEPDFDRYTALAAELLHAPVSLVSLLEHDRQVFKSSRGLDEAWARAGETPLSHSLCRYPVQTGEPFVVGDARRDPRTRESLAVRDLDIGAYAGMPLTLADGHVVGALCAIDPVAREWTALELRILEDLAAAVSSLLELRRAIGRQTLHDALTGLPNRSLTVAHCERLTQGVGGRELLALAVGIDDIGSVNASYGVTHGDRLIEAVARRIGEELGADDVLGRLGGDTFLVLRPTAGDARAAVDFAHRLRAAVSHAPVSVRGDQLGVSVTIGMTSAGPGVDGDALVDRALQSLSDAKSAGERVRLAETDACRTGAARARLRGALAGAVARGEISVAFQPIVGLASGRTRGYEALARWRHPEHGLVEPSRFIPLAEETGDIVRIGEHVLRIACGQLSLWRRALSATELGVTVNLSPVQLGIPNIAEVVGEILLESGLPGPALTLELTEGVFIASGPVQRRNIEMLRELGVRFAIDDFGTGYSALSYLKRFPVDLLKIDRCFLAGLETDERDAALMRAILSIGAGMQLEVVAEGVETRAQRELLRLSGCHWGQGYLFSEPRSAEEIGLPAIAPPPLAAVD